MDDCNTSIIFSILFNLSSIDSVFASIVVLKSITFSNGFLISDSLSETTCSEISVIGRATQGVRVMRMNEGDQLAAAAKIIIEEGEVSEEELSNQQD